MSSATQVDGFTEVTRRRKKRKASSSPTLPSQPKPLGTPVRPKSSVKNSIPVILSGVDEKFKNWKTLMGELRQYHPSLKISRIKELLTGDFLVIGDSVQDVIILQSESNAAVISCSVSGNLMKPSYQTTSFDTIFAVAFPRPKFEPTLWKHSFVPRRQFILGWKKCEQKID